MRCEVWKVDPSPTADCQNCGEEYGQCDDCLESYEVKCPRCDQWQSLTYRAFYEPALCVELLTAMICLGHAGSDLTILLTGFDALVLICRPSPGMAHAVPMAMGAVTL